MLKRINDALPGLVFGIVFYGIVVQLIGVWFVTDKISYSIGLWYGLSLIHIYHVQEIHRGQVYKFETDQPHLYRNDGDRVASCMCFFLDYTNIR